MTDSTLNENKDHIKVLQVTILLINVLIMGIGGAVFGLSVAVRPILRIIKPAYFDELKQICDLMVAAGLLQIGSSGLNCFVSAWRLITPTMIAIIVTMLEVVIEMSAIATTIMLYTKEDEIAVETDALLGSDDMHPWFVLECGRDPCSWAFSSMFYNYMVPQLVLTIIATILQTFSLVYLGRFLRFLQNRKRRIQNAAKHRDQEDNL